MARLSYELEDEVMCCECHNNYSTTADVLPIPFPDRDHG